MIKNKNKTFLQFFFSVNRLIFSNNSTSYILEIITHYYKQNLRVFFEKVLKNLRTL